MYRKNYLEFLDRILHKIFRYKKKNGLFLGVYRIVTLEITNKLFNLLLLEVTDRNISDFFKIPQFF